MTQEKAAEITARLEKIVADQSKNAMWNEARAFKRDPALESLTIKNEAGERLYNPESNKERHAQYFESLYKAKQFNHHPYHDMIPLKK